MRQDSGGINRAGGINRTGYGLRLAGEAELLDVEQGDHVLVAAHEPCHMPSGAAVKEAEAHDVHVSEAPKRAPMKARPDAPSEALAPPQSAAEEHLDGGDVTTGN